MTEEIVAARQESLAPDATVGVVRSQYDKLFRSYVRLAGLVSESRGVEAEEHWRRHMGSASAALLKGYEKTQVRDILY